MRHDASSARFGLAGGAPAGFGGLMWRSCIGAVACATVLSGCGYTISVTPNNEVVTETQVVTQPATSSAVTPPTPAVTQSTDKREADAPDQLTRDVCEPALDELPDLVDTSDNGYYVYVIQEVALSFGLDPGPVDGQYGPRTIGAVMELQAIVGADVDGQVGPQTWGAIRSVFCPALSSGAGASLPNLMSEDDLITTLRDAFPGWGLEGVPPPDLSGAMSSWYASSPDSVLEISGAVAFAFLYADEGAISPSEVVYLDTTMRNVAQTFPLVKFDRIRCGNVVFITRVEARSQFEQALPSGITCRAV